MDRKAIKSFGIPIEDGIGILVTMFLMMYDESKCAKCELIHDMILENNIKILNDYPGSEEERHFLFFMFGSLAQHQHIWVAFATVMLLFKDSTQEERIKIAEQFVIHYVFSDSTVNQTPITHHHPN